VFDVALRLLHPVMPFITETLWLRLPRRSAAVSLSVAPWPRPDDRARDAAALRDFGLVQELVGAVRAIRAEYGVAPGRSVRVHVTGGSPATGTALTVEQGTVGRLAKVSALSLDESDERVGGHAVLSDGSAVFVPLGDAIDLQKECARLGAEVDRLLGLIGGQERKLANESFTARAPVAVVERERQKLDAWREQAGVLTQKRELLGCGR
jgi:valyl-tRNA synthetase